MKKTQLRFVLVVFFLLAVAAKMAVNEIMAARSAVDNWLTDKKEQAISCGVSFGNRPDDKRNSTVTGRHPEQNGDHNGNGCPHQSEASLIPPFEKRKYRKHLSCS